MNNGGFYPSTVQILPIRAPWPLMLPASLLLPAAISPVVPTYSHPARSHRAMAAAGAVEGALEVRLAEEEHDEDEDERLCGEEGEEEEDVGVGVDVVGD